MDSNRIDIFLCYRHAYAQTAKLFKKFLTDDKLYSKACNRIWYSNHQPKGNYLLDVEKLIQSSEKVVLFLAKGFTDGFWNRRRRKPNYNNMSVNERDCVTVKEIIEIEKKRQADPNFEIITINIDGYELTKRDCRILKKVFLYEKIYKDESLYHFTKCNVNPFNPAVDLEEVLFNQIAQALFDNDFFQKHSLLGNFSFNTRTPTYVDIALWEVDKEIHTKDIEFIPYGNESDELPLYHMVANAKSDFSFSGQNDQMISFVRSSIDSHDDSENRILTIYYRLIDYVLNRKCKYLHKIGYGDLPHAIAQFDIDSDLFSIPNAMGLSLSVITSDGYFIFSRRPEFASDGVSKKIRGGEYDNAVVEGLKPIHISEREDFVREECMRGYCEEVINTNNQETLYINGLILDREYSEWNLIGTIFSSATKDEIQARFSTRRDLTEKNKLFFVPLLDENGIKTLQFFNDALIQYRRNSMWGTALATMKASLLRFGFTEEDIETLL